MTHFEELFMLSQYKLTSIDEWPTITRLPENITRRCPACGCTKVIKHNLVSNALLKVPYMNA